MENFVSRAFQRSKFYHGNPNIAVNSITFVVVFVFNGKKFLDFDGKFCNIFYYIIVYTYVILRRGIFDVNFVFSEFEILP